jgi:hypothetical protein
MLPMNRRATVAARALLCSAVMAAAPAAWAQTEVILDTLLFGHLDQNLTDCPLIGCGPTAVVNSFVYLQNYYAELSIGPKAPAPPTIVTDTSQAGLIALTKKLAPQMGCAASCPANTGAMDRTKRKYLSENKGGWVPMVTRTDTLTWKWITDTLKDGVDIELLVSDGTLDHFITLTGYRWTDANRNGRVDGGEATIHFIDPEGGTDETRAIEVDAQGRVALIGYDLDETSPEVPPAQVTDGLAEWLVASNVPEPASWLLMAAGGLLLAARHRARRNRR